MCRTAAAQFFNASFCSCTLLIVVATVAQAGPIQSSYTVVDLGNDPDGLMTTNAGGTAVVSPNGQVAYPFAQTDWGTYSVPNLASLPVPVPTPTPAEYDDLVNSSRASQATLFPNGIAIAIDQVVQNFGPSDTMVNYVPYYVQQNANGSWGQPVTLPGGYTYQGPAPTNGPSGGMSYGFNQAGDVLVGTPIQTLTAAATSYGYFIDNINTQTETYLNTLPVLVNNGFSNLRVLAMDADRRILMLANGPTGSDDLVLVSPPGVSSAPIPFNTPEPSSFAVMALAVAAFARARFRRQRSGVHIPSLKAATGANTPGVLR